MHESTIAGNIIAILEQRLQANPGTELLSVTVVIGEFRNVDKESLEFAFDALKRDNAGCASCQLICETIEVCARCTNGHQYHPTLNNKYQCHCGAGMDVILQGNELDIIQVKLTTLIEEPSDARNSR